MKTAIVHISKPNPTEREKLRAWEALDTAAVFQSGNTKGATKLQEGVWQIQTTTALYILSLIVVGAHDKGLECKVMFLGDDSQWISIPPKTA